MPAEPLPETDVRLLPWLNEAVFLVVGCGSIGRRHARNLKALGVRHIWTYDVDAARAQSLAEEVGGLAWTDWDAVLQAGPQVALICTPPVFHIPQALDLARQGIHLFIEKPLAADLTGVDDLVNTVQTHHLHTLVGCNFRFHPGLQRLRDWLNEGRLGKPLFARATFGQFLPDWHPWEDYRHGYSARRDLGGGVLLDRIHEFDTLWWLFGPFHQVMGWINHTGTLEIETEDLVEAWLTFRNHDLRASVHTDYLNREYTCTLDVLGTEGTARWSYAPHMLELYRPGPEPMRERLEWPHYDGNTMYVEEMRHFLRVLAGLEPSMKPVEQARALLRGVLAVQESATNKTWQTVY